MRNIPTYNADGSTFVVTVNYISKSERHDYTKLELPQLGETFVLHGSDGEQYQIRRTI